ncbi:hypothetical protein Pan216_09280 [Planctomycetes bacterium Pan216]|uniref:LarA-like N-terminal domain-containing protein n=1 Tax=Kolteria novifilia TaxID=2527975 RepID=A0A518AZF7_9BACT|nr:hypothetical protein Pan216_09280 [Planctomycetes bacterium Pan216]
MAEYIAEGSETTIIDEAKARRLIDEMLAQLGPLNRVLILPPDITRYHSWAGKLTQLLYQSLDSGAHVEIMPTIGTHFPMSDSEIEKMYSGIPRDRFRDHDWRHGLARLGVVPGEKIHELSGGRLDYPINIEVNPLLVEGDWDAILSVGQLVPHEVIGIANHAKNVFVGVGGADTINKTHYLGAVVGMESIMGRAANPVRAVFEYASEHFADELPITYLLTVRGRDSEAGLVTRGLYAGNDTECFYRGAKLCQQANLNLLDEPLPKVVVYLEPEEFKSTWLGNKAVYRTRMAIADDGELIVLAPGVREFGEDPEIDRLIRKYGYRGIPKTLANVAENPELAQNLSAAAHLMHGSSEDRFKITYCPGHLSQEEIEGVNFAYADLATMAERYNPETLTDGINQLPDGEEIFYISNPGQGLWGLRSLFEGT